MDQTLFDLIHSLAGKSSLIDWGMVLLAQYLPYALALAAAVLVVKGERGKERMARFAALVLTALLSRGLLTELIRLAWPRPRPSAALGFEPLLMPSTGASFPSGHAAFFFALAAAIFFFDRRWGWWFLGFSAVNAVARVVVGVHWPSDVLIGALLGVLSFLVVRFLLRESFERPKTAD